MKTRQASGQPRPPRQSRGMAAPLFMAFPALAGTARSWSSEYPTLLFKRGKEDRLYDIDGNRYLDFALDGGRLLFGHAPSFLTQAVKNALSGGELDGLPALALSRFHTVLRRIIPGLDGWRLHFVPDPAVARVMLAEAFPGWTPLRPETLVVRGDRTALDARLEKLEAGGNPLILDEGDSFLTGGFSSLAGERQPEGALLGGILGFSLLLLRPGHDLEPLPWLPDRVSLTRAVERMRAVAGPRAPYGRIAALARLFAERYRGTISGWCGFSPKIGLTPAAREELLREGFLLEASGQVHFCSCHTDAALLRLVKLLEQLQTKKDNDT